MKKFTKLSALVALGVCITVSAFADDLNPPPWRGGLGTTFQHWRFNQVQTGNWLPEELQQHPSLGVPSYLEPGGFSWLPSFGGPTGPGLRLGVISIPSAGVVRFVIPNYGDPNGPKYIRVQLTWFSGNPDTKINVPSGAEYAGSVTTNPLADGWNHSTIDFVLPTNPTMEFTVIRNLTNEPVYLDQAVIDTLCVPEPGAIAALGIGALALIRRRRTA